MILNSSTVSLVTGFIGTLMVRLILKSGVYKWWIPKNKQIVLLPVNPKMAIIVRNDVKMTFGKQLAQICHAGLLAYNKCLKSNSILLKQWIKEGGPVVIGKLSSNGESKLREIQEKAYKLNVNIGLIRDAGHTQVKSGTMTAISIGPANFDIIKIICDDIVKLDENLSSYKSTVAYNMKQEVDPWLVNITK